MLANKIRICHRLRFSRKTFLCAATQHEATNSAQRTRQRVISKGNECRPRKLDADNDLAIGLVRLHQPVHGLNVFETKHLRRFGLVGARRDAFDHSLEGHIR